MNPLRLCEIVTDVSVREGSQQKVDLLNLPAATKLEIASQAAAAGVQNLEITAFAPGAWFSDAEEIAEKASMLPQAVALRALYFNSHGLETLLKYPRFHAEGMFHTAVTSGYREKNYRQNSDEEVLGKLSKLIIQLRSKELALDTVVLSTVWGEPGIQAGAEETVKLLKKIMERGRLDGLVPRTVTLCDTEGQASAQEIKAVVAAVKMNFPETTIRMHLHPAKDRAVACIQAAISEGATEWEGSWGGMGGSPHAGEAGGNLDIRHLISVWNENGWEHGFNINEVRKLITLLKATISRHVEEISL